MAFTPSGDFTHENAATQLAAGLTAIAAGQVVISFSQTLRIDSSAVACMLAWKRSAGQQGTSLRFEHLPESLTSLVGLYGVAQLL
jgi:phospholipid transport system transporter-binding protein